MIKRIILNSIPKETTVFLRLPERAVAFLLLLFATIDTFKGM